MTEFLIEADKHRVWAPRSIGAGLVLAPAACLNVYAAFADRALVSPVVATTAAQCGRHEPGDGASATNPPLTRH